jgi:hypothetical protein
MILAGAVATVAFDLTGQSRSPGLGFASFAPVPLANSAIQKLFGAPFEPVAQLLHYIAGLVAYPFGWMFIATPLARRITPAFLGFTGITWVALVGHVLFAFVAAAVVRWCEDLPLGMRAAV